VTYGTDSVTAHFTDNTSVTGTVLVGADGPRSTIRTLLLGSVAANTIPIGVDLYSLHVCYDTAEKALHARSAAKIFSIAITTENWTHFTCIQDVLDPEKPETWTFYLLGCWTGMDESLTNAERMSDLKSRASRMAEPFKSTLLWVPDDTEVIYNKIHYWEPVPWDNHGGRITLCGDAGHNLPPFRGQGLNNCILDVWHLVEGFKAIAKQEKGLNEMVDEYEKEMIARSLEELSQTKATALAMLSLDALKESPIYKKGVTTDKES
jgi:2-polyprenyl-6-methoxyphenol hydroxylase-like FAD-dependent oxidoreductase